MWSVGSKPHDVYLGTRAVVVCQGAELLRTSEVGGLDAALDALKTWLESSPVRRRLRVWLSGTLCRPFVVPAVPGVKTREELRQVALALAAQQTGLAGACKVWVDGGARSGPSVAVALPDEVLEKIYITVATANGKHTIVSVRPWWAELLRYVLVKHPTAPAISVQDCDSLTFLAGTGGGFDIVTTYTPIADADTARSALARALLSADIGPGEEVSGRLVLQGMPREQITACVALTAILELSR